MYGLPKTITNSQGQKELVGSYTYWKLWEQISTCTLSTETKNKQRI
jgi:hypothetical protein